MQGYVWKKGLIFGVIFLLMASNGLAVGVGTKVVNTNAIRADDSVSAGESDDTWWPMFHHDLNHTGVSSSSAPETNTLLWMSPTGYWLEASPVVADGKVFIGSEDKKLYCFDALTGAELWNYPTYDLIVSTPAVADGRVYFGSTDHRVRCLNESTGALIWDYCTGWIIAQSSPAVVDGKVFIGSHDYKVYCLDAKTGSELWEFPTGYFISSSPAVVGDRVYIGSFDGNLYCLNASTGGLIWVCVLIYTIWTSSPTVYDGRVYIGALDFELHCIDASTGTQLWNFSTGDFMTGTAAVYDGKVYVGSWDNTFYCLNATTGGVVWEYLTGGPIDSSPAIADGKVYFGSSDQSLYCLDAETGSKIWQYATGGQILSSPAVAKGKVYVGSLDNNVYCFGDLENQPPVADFQWTPTVPSDGQPVVFDASLSYDPDGSIVLYEWDWNNDGVFEESSQNATTTHIWFAPGSYPVTLRVTDDNTAVDSVSKTIEVVHENQPPETPTLQGNTRGKIGNMYLYSFVAADPDGDGVSYVIDWGDGTPETTIGPYPSGEVASAHHAWSAKGTYLVKAKARDVYGSESDWGTLSVTMPCSYVFPFQQLLLKLLERFPAAFPFLRHFLRH
jgi:outer membrane protein assembly factor BamB